MAMLKTYWESKKCPECGKQFTVLDTQEWAYKRPYIHGHKYFCSWKCLRAEEKKREKKPREKRKAEEIINVLEMRHRNQRDVMLAAVEEIEKGGDPLALLKKIGYADPKERWRHLIGWAKDYAEDLYERIPEEAKQQRKRGRPKRTA